MAKDEQDKLIERIFDHSDKDKKKENKKGEK